MFYPASVWFSSAQPCQYDLVIHFLFKHTEITAQFEPKKPPKQP